MPSITVQPELLLERILSLEIVRVTERAAVASFKREFRVEFSARGNRLCERECDIQLDLIEFT